MAVAVILLIPGKRYPADGRAAMNPSNPAGMPAEADEETWRVSDKARHRRQPEPGAMGFDIDPRAVVMGDIAERLIGNPAVVAVIDGPATGGKRPPPPFDPGRPPHIPIGSLIIDSLPPAILFEIVGFLPNRFRQVARRGFAAPQARLPEFVALAIPVVPFGIDRAISAGDFPLVGDNRRIPLQNLIPGIRAGMHEIHVAVHGDDFQGNVTDIEVEDRSARGNDIAERRRHLDDDVFAFVVQPGKTRGHIHGRGIRIEIDKLDLGILARPHPGSVGHHELGLGKVTRIERIV